MFRSLNSAPLRMPEIAHFVCVCVCVSHNNKGKVYKALIVKREIV